MEGLPYKLQYSIAEDGKDLRFVPAEYAQSLRGENQPRLVYGFENGRISDVTIFALKSRADRNAAEGDHDDTRMSAWRQAHPFLAEAFDTYFASKEFLGLRIDLSVENPGIELLMGKGDTDMNRRKRKIREEEWEKGIYGYKYPINIKSSRDINYATRRYSQMVLLNDLIPVANYDFDPDANVFTYRLDYSKIGKFHDAVALRHQPYITPDQFTGLLGELLNMVPTRVPS